VAALSSCLIAALAACTGSAATPSVVAMVTGYYRAILTRNYQKSIQAKEKLRWALRGT
jgi:hypothetical protein